MKDSAAKTGDTPPTHGSADTLVPLLYDELRRLAERVMRGERVDHTLQATALVHETYLRLAEERSLERPSDAAFSSLAAGVIRQVLIDHARKRSVQKRGGGRTRVELDESGREVVARPARSDRLLSLDAALEKLARIDPRQSRIVELRFFGGLTVAQVAEALELSKRTVESEWALARAWLAREIEES